MAYNIIGNITYSTAANKNTALANINAVLANYTWTGVTTNLPAGIGGTSTSITISIRVNDEDAEAVRMELKNAWTSATRATSGHYIGAVKV